MYSGFTERHFDKDNVLSKFVFDVSYVDERLLEGKIEITGISRRSNPLRGQ